ncbi:glutathione S-transferase [Pigmentiphaga soli]|uniref:Glutathione S-transferase n=1 Tax=Pigmentiphaga soli TaxID=1007095 RepID=A0ABP8HMX3_9BURK
MPILRTSPPSPFGRKIKIALAVLGLEDKVQVQYADTADASDSLRQQNPLGKIPTLILDNGEALFDSRVIIEYLEETDGRGILIPPAPHRIPVLRQQALADGLLDAAILQIYEGRFRPAEMKVQSWLDYQQAKVQRALDFAEAQLSQPRAGTPHIGEIAQAVALAYLDFRFGGKWRAGHPKLVAWLADFEQRTPAFARTAPPAA